MNNWIETGRARSICFVSWLCLMMKLYLCRYKVIRAFDESNLELFCQMFRLVWAIFYSKIMRALSMLERWCRSIHEKAWKVSPSAHSIWTRETLTFLAPLFEHKLRWLVTWPKTKVCWIYNTTIPFMYCFLSLNANAINNSLGRKIW